MENTMSIMDTIDYVGIVFFSVFQLVNWSLMEVCKCQYNFKSLRPSDAYMRQ